MEEELFCFAIEASSSSIVVKLSKASLQMVIEKGIEWLDEREGDDGPR